MKKITGIILLCIILIGLFFAIWFKKSTSHVNSVQGQVRDIYIGGLNDIIIILDNDTKRYYINRGTEKGLSKEKLIDEFRERTIQITVKPNGVNLLDLKDELQEITQITINDSIIYSE